MPFVARSRSSECRSIDRCLLIYRNSPRKSVITLTESSILSLRRRTIRTFIVSTLADLSQLSDDILNDHEQRARSRCALDLASLLRLCVCVYVSECFFYFILMVFIACSKVLNNVSQLAEFWPFDKSKPSNHGADSLTFHSRGVLVSANLK